MRWPSKPDLLALAFLAFLTLIFFWPVTLGQGWIPRGGGDLVSFLWPTYSYAAQSLRAGRIPLWNPTLYSGMPFAADNQSGLFYPINLLTFLLVPSLPYAAMEWLVIFHVWLAGASMYGLMRVLLSSSFFSFFSLLSCLFPAVAYMFSDVFVTHVGNLNILVVSAWLPAAFAALHLALTRRSVNWAVLAGVSLGVAALAGHAQMTLIMAGALGLYAAWHIAGGGWPLRVVHRTPVDKPPTAAIGDMRYALLLTALTFMTAFGVSALSVIPAAELIRHTARARLDYAAASDYSLPWAGLAGLFSPLIFGRGAAHFWGPWQRVELGYLGVLPLLFSGFAPRRARRGLTIFLMVLGAFGLLVALGANAPLHRLLYWVVPGFAQLRVPARFILLTDFALAVLAGLGLHNLLTAKDTKGAKGKVWGWGGLLAALALIAIFLGYRSAILATGTEHVVNLYLGLALTLGMLFVGLLLITFRGRLGRLFPAFALVILSADLIGQGAWVEVERNDPTLGFQHPAAAAFLQSQPGPVRVDNASGAWAPEAAARFGLEDIGGVSNPLALAAYQTYLGAVGPRGTPLYNFLNAQFVIADKGVPPADDTFAPVFNEDPALDVYLNTNAQPRVRLVYSTTVAVDGEAAFAAIHAPGFDPATSVVAEDLTPLAPTAPSGDSNLFYVAYAPEAFTVVARSPAPGYLVFSEVWYPGWRAWVDGVEAPIFRANFAFRGVALKEGGEHTVVMRFDPLSWKVGLGITLLTLVALLVRGAYSVYAARTARHV